MEFMREKTVQSVSAQMDTVEVDAQVSITHNIYVPRNLGICTIRRSRYVFRGWSYLKPICKLLQDLQMVKYNQ